MELVSLHDSIRNKLSGSDCVLAFETASDYLATSFGYVMEKSRLNAGVEANNKVKEFNVIYANDPNRVEKYNLLTKEVLVYDSGALKGEMSDFSINVIQNDAKITITPRTINVFLTSIA